MQYLRTGKYEFQRLIDPDMSALQALGDQGWHVVGFMTAYIETERQAFTGGFETPVHAVSIPDIKHVPIFYLERDNPNYPAKR